jgi:hypothetical protein
VNIELGCSQEKGKELLGVEDGTKNEGKSPSLLFVSRRGWRRIIRANPAAHLAVQKWPIMFHAVALGCRAGRTTE